ncbi:MAG: STAS domain-containing protein [Deltaproteobacteria bacterium]|nr:STAS domain-containing protein [Deltaproteobacteria bacterium]MBN2671101.1 STAS domain-containing protein [Deltaproteobacteria bacterium]
MKTDNHVKELRMPALTLDFVESAMETLNRLELEPNDNLDLSAVRQIDTAGAQLLISYARTTGVRYKNLTDEIQTFFQTAGFATAFKQFEVYP